MGARGIKSSKEKQSKNYISTTDPKIKLKPEELFPTNIELQQKILLDQEPVIFDCAIIHKLLLFVDCSDQNKRIIVHDLSTKHSRSIPLSHDPRGITAINNNTVVISYPRNHSIDIISIDTGLVKKTVTFEEECWGLSSEKGLIYVIIFKKRIDVLTVKGKTKRSFALPTLTPLFMKVFKRKLYCADQRNLFCCNADNGIILWTFQSDKIELICGVTIDEIGNIYVVGNYSHNVIVVSSDGKNWKEILTKCDGLDTPMAINYDISRRHLLVCNQLNGEVVYFVLGNW